MVKIVNPLGDVKTGKQGEAVYQRHYGEQIRRTVSPKRAMASQKQIEHRQLYRTALDWRSQLSLANRRYLEGYCIANGIVDAYHIPLPWSRFALKLYLEKVRFIPYLDIVTTDPEAAEMKDKQEGTAAGDLDLGLTIWMMQNFTPSESYTIDKVELALSRYQSPMTVQVGIRNTDGNGHPTGGDLAYGETDGNTLPIEPAFEWREIELSNYALVKDVKYALVLRAPGAASTNRLRWRYNSDSESYPRGWVAYSTDSGLNWNDWPFDAAFRVWSAYKAGEKTKEGILHVRHPALLAVVHKRGALIVRAYDTLSSLDEEYLTGQVGLDVELGDSILATTLPGIEYPYEIL